MKRININQIHIACKNLFYIVYRSFRFYVFLKFPFDINIHFDIYIIISM